VILQRVMSGAAAAGAAAAGGAVITVALAYALYAFAKIWLVPAASAAVVALVFAAVFGIGAAVMAGKARGGKAGGKTAKHLKNAHEEPRTLLERAMDTARERPVVAAAGALAAGLLALRNPALVATVIGLINQPPRPRRD
jgi:hypothetical protein